MNQWDLPEPVARCQVVIVHEPMEGSPFVMIPITVLACRPVYWLPINDDCGSVVRVAVDVSPPSARYVNAARLGADFQFSGSVWCCVHRLCSCAVV